MAGPSVLVSAAATVWSILKVVAQSVFTFDRHQAVFRSAVFLIVFLVAHALGNLTYFFGPGVMNRYGHLLESNPLIWGIEAYLALVFVLHLMSASVNTLKSGKLQAKWTWRSLKLSITGTVLLAFIIVHLKSFKFGAEYKMVTKEQTVVRDLYRLVDEHFADPWYVSFYLVSMAALLFHLRGGWKRGVLRLDLPKQHRSNARAIGELMALFVCAIFVAITAYSHFK